jgi:hypothetical protein
MPIFKTSGIKTGDLRLFDIQGLKFKLRYKIICKFHRIKRIFGKIYYKNIIITDSYNCNLAWLLLINL